MIKPSCSRIFDKFQGCLNVLDFGVFVSVVIKKSQRGKGYGRNVMEKTEQYAAR